jgi:hypothetical protein
MQKRKELVGITRQAILMRELVAIPADHDLTTQCDSLEVILLKFLIACRYTICAVRVQFE